jgi:hypothetical protein
MAEGPDTADGPGDSDLAAEAASDPAAEAASKRAATAASDRAVRRFYLWLLFVVILPYLIYGFAEESFAATFRSGGASLFICIALIAAIGEGVVKVLDQAFSHEPIGPLDSDSLVAWYVIGTALFAWNMYFAVADKTVRVPSVDWVQIVAFVLGLIAAGYARWATDETLIALTAKA